MRSPIQKALDTAVVIQAANRKLEKLSCQHDEVEQTAPNAQGIVVQTCVDCGNVEVC